MIHPYITAYEETGSYSAVARQFNTHHKAVRKIVHPEKHAMMTEQKNSKRRAQTTEKNRIAGNNKRYLEYFGRLASE